MNTIRPLAGRHAFATGAGGGVGDAVARALAREEVGSSLPFGTTQVSAGFVLAPSLADGPWLVHGVTRTMLDQEWGMGLDEMVESDAQAQAICMTRGDFRRAFEAFAAKRKPAFEED